MQNVCKKKRAVSKTAKKIENKEESVETLNCGSERVLRPRFAKNKQKNEEVNVITGTIVTEKPLNCSTPSKKPLTNRVLDEANLTISPISFCKESIREEEGLSAQKKSTVLTGNVKGDNVDEQPSWKKSRKRLTYGGARSTEVENQDPFSLFGSPKVNSPKNNKVNRQTKFKKKEAPVADPKYNAEFARWCKTFNEDLEAAENTELIVE